MKKEEVTGYSVSCILPREDVKLQPYHLSRLIISGNLTIRTINTGDCLLIPENEGVESELLDVFNRLGVEICRHVINIVQDEVG